MTDKIDISPEAVATLLEERERIDADFADEIKRRGGTLTELVNLAIARRTTAVLRAMAEERDEAMATVEGMITRMRALRDAQDAVRGFADEVKQAEGEAAIAAAHASGFAEALQLPQLHSSFQNAVAAWMEECFGAVIAADVTERNHRFLEEALELVQANGTTRGEALQLVDYVYDRPAGEVGQEIGGVMVTLAALCEAVRLNMEVYGDIELKRCWDKIEKIRAKQAAKPRHGPLPEAPATVTVPVEPTLGLLMSMAIRMDHALGHPGYYDASPDSMLFDPHGPSHAQRVKCMLSEMRQVHEEIVGTGFYKPKKEDDYRSLIPNDALVPKDPQR